MLKAQIYKGSIIAAVYTKDTIQLLSDGRLMNAVNASHQADDKTKVFKISDKCGMITSGLLIRNLHDYLVTTSRAMGLVFTDDIAELAHEFLREGWAELANNGAFRTVNNPNFHIKFCGYDAAGLQRMFTIFVDGSDVPTVREEPITYSHDRPLNYAVKSVDGADNIFLGHLLSDLGKNSGQNMHSSARSAFEVTVDEISRTTPSVGGQIFEARITPSGFTFVK